MPKPPSTPSRRPAIIAALLGILALSCLVPRPAVAQISCGPLADTTLPNSGARVCHVAHNWGLIPTSSLNVGDRFRLLLITSNTRGRDSNNNIATYNTFVQNRITTHGHADIRAYASEFLAVVSTNQNVDARDNTHTSFAGGESGDGSNDGRGVPIYWLGGPNEKLADNNFPGFWDNGRSGWAGTGAARRGRNENGVRLDAGTRVWTGTGTDGRGVSGNRFGDLGPYLGRPDRQGFEIFNNFDSAENRGFYALSPIFHISTGISLDASTPAPESSYQYPIDVAIAPLVLPSATGGTGTLSYALTGTLPTGLAFDTATRTLSGTPNTATTASASLTYTITASESPITLALTFTVDVKAAGITWTGGNIVETAANDGTISGEVVATLTGDTFTAGACANYASGNVVTAFPAGNTIGCTRTSDTEATFTYGSQADSHADADDLVGAPPYDIDDPNITFADGAFTNSAAADVANSAYFGITFDFNDPDPINFPDIEAQSYPTHAQVAFTLPEARGGTGPFTYALRPATLPAGLTFDPATRAITGTPFETTAADTFIYTATDATGTGATAFTITVTTGTPPATNTAAVAPTITGTLTFSSTLSVDPAGITDANGILTDTTFAYQWQQGAPDGTETGWAAITDAIASEYTILAAQGRRRLRVQISFTDAAGHLEIIASAATDALPAAAAISDATGTPMVTGTAQAGMSLEVANTSGVPNGITDTNGTTRSVFAYQWQQGESGGADSGYTDLPGATSSSLRLTESHAGRYLRVVVSFLDDAGYPESRTSDGELVSASTETNDVASTTSSPSITGTLRVGFRLSGTFLSSDIDDTNGVSNEGQFKWQQGPPDGTTIASSFEDIPGSVGSFSLILTDAQEGRSIRLVYFYFDDDGFYEELMSLPSAAVAAATPRGFVFAPATVAIAEGTATTYTVKLATPLFSDDPNITRNELVAVTSDNPLAVTATPLFLNFTQFTWNTPQTVTVTAHQDANGIDETVTLTHTAPGEYGASAPLQVSVTDDEESELTLTTAALTLDEATTTTYSVSLAAVPTGDATVTIVSDNTALVTTSPTTLAFTTFNWETPQPVTVTAHADDTNASDDTATLTHTAMGGYDAVLTLPVTVTDDDTAQLSLDNVNANEADGTATLSVDLNLEVTGGFSIDVTTADATATAADYTALTSHTLNFAGTAGETQTVALTITDDDIAENTETLSVTLSNLQGTTTAVDLPSAATVTIEDNDLIPALTFDTATIALPETDYTYIAGAAIPTLTLPPATGGIPSLTYTLSGTLPADLTFDATARTLTGTPTASANAVTLTYTVTDSTDSSRTAPTPLMRTFTVTINEAISFGTSTIENQAYIVDQTIPTLTLPTATGGVPTLTYALTGTRPAGLTYTGGSDTTGGVLAGTPTAGAVATTLTYTATDAESNSVALEFMVSASTIPTVVSVTADAASITASPLTTGEALDIVLTFSEAIVITGNPQLALNTGNSGDGVAGLFGVSADGLTATFEYTVRAGDNTADLAYTGTGALTLPGSATIRNQADTQDAILTLPMPGAANSLSASATIVLDTAAPVFGITGTTSASPARINVTLDTAANTVIHNAAADDDTALIYALGGTDATAFSLSTTGALSPVADLGTENTYSIDITATDAAGNAATLYLSVVVADIPVLTSVTSDAAGPIANIADDRLTFTAVWSEAVDGFRHNDVNVIGGGAFGGELTLRSIDGQRTYTFTVQPDLDTNDGVITIRVSEDAVTPVGGGNGNVATTFYQNYDTAAPSTPTITTPAANAIITATAGVPLTGGGVETGGSITLCLPGGSGTSCGSSDSGRTLRDVPVTGTDWAYTLTADDITAMGQGSETLNVIANDAAGNPSLPFTRTITVDTTAADPTINEVSGGFINAAERTTGVEVTGSIGSDTLAITLCLNPVDAAVADCDGAGGGFDTTIDTATTTWSRTLTNAELTPFGEGVLTFTAIATDARGNMAVSAAEMVTVDITAPGAPVIGTVATDDTINDAEQRAGVPISGTTDTATTVTLCFGGSNAACAGGSTSTATVTGTVWTYTLDTADYTAMGQGDETLRATAFDAAGNPSTETTLDIDIDTVLPVFPGTATTTTERRTISVATRTVANTNIYDADATDNGDFVAETADTGLTYTLGGTDAMTFSLDTDGILTPVSDLPDSVTTYSVEITARDAAGNEATQYLTVDVVEQPTVRITSNVGIDNTANSANGALTFTFTFSEDVSDFVTGDITANGGGNKGAFAGTGRVYTLVVPPTADTNDGMLTISVAANMATGDSTRRGNLAASETQAYDTLAPSVPTFSAVTFDDIIDANNMGGGFFIGGETDVDTTVTLCFGGCGTTRATNKLDGATSWTYNAVPTDITALGQGTGRTLTATATDAAGNASVGTHSVTVDTIAPATPVITTPIAVDNFINAVEQTTGFAVTITSSSSDTDTVTLCLGATDVTNTDCTGGDPYPATATGTSMTWSYMLTGTNLSGLTDGVLTMTAIAADAVGNQTVSSGRNVTVDTVAPTAPAIDAVSTDNRINDAERTATVTVTGTNAVIGSDASSDTSTVTLCAGATTTTNPVCTGTSFTAAAATTTWSYTLDATEINAFGEGVTTLTAIAADTAGNTAASGGSDITVDFTLPMFPGTATTNTERMEISAATGTDAGTTIYDAMATDNSRSPDTGLTYILGGTNSAIFTLDTNTGVLAPVSNLPATVTTYSIDITATDEAGNAATQYLTIALVNRPTLDITSNVGIANTANIDNGALTFTFTFREPVTGFMEDEISVTGGDKGTFTGTGPSAVYTLVVTPTADTNDGMLTISVADDVAIGGTTGRGNLAASETQAYDTAAPMVPSIDEPIAGEGNFINAAERTAGVTVTGGTGAIGSDTSTITLCAGTTSATDATCTGTSFTATTTDAATTWSYPLTTANINAFNEGPETLTAIATDAAGNTAVSTSVTITIDTEAPTAPVITTMIADDDFINAAERDTGVTVTGTKTSDTDTVTICFGGTDAACAGGTPRTITVTGTTWSYPLVDADYDAMGQGAETLYITATDAASNTSAAITHDITVDTTVPVFTSGDTGAVRVGAATSVTAYDAEATDNSGATDAGITYTLGVANVGLFDIVAATGVVTYKTVQSTVTDHGITVTATDTAGNAAMQNVVISVLDVPSAPAGVTLVPGNTQLTVSWTAVPDANNGGAAILTYTATATDTTNTANTFNCSTATGAATGCFITGLTNGTEYSVTVVATNSQGNSDASTAATDTPMVPAQGITAPTAPPTSVMLVPGDTQLSVSWTAVLAANNGGAPITKYTATATGNSMTFTCTAIGDAAATACSDPIKGLTNGTAYSVTVVATNSVGDSAPSTPVVTAMPMVTPAVVLMVTAMGGGYGIGDEIHSIVTFDKPVTVTGIPELDDAPFTGGSGSVALTFTYTVAEGDDIPSLDYSGTAALTLPVGAAINNVDVPTIVANLTLPEPTIDDPFVETVIVDGIRPYPMSATINAARNVITATASEPVTAVGLVNNGFTLRGPSPEVTVTDFELISDSALTLTLNRAIGAGETATLVWVPDSTYYFMDNVGNTMNAAELPVTIQSDLSDDAMLSALSVTPAGDTEELTLTPDFVPGVFTYTANAPAFTATVTVAANASDNDATIGIAGTDPDDNTLTVPAGTTTGTFSGAVSGLDEGDNTLTMTVTAEDTSTMLTYTLTLTVPTSTPAAAGTATALAFTPPDSTTPTTVYVTVPDGNDNREVAATPLPTPPPAPAGVEFGVTVDIDINTQLDSGMATVCLPTTGVPDGLEPVLYHYNDTSEVWDDIGRNTATRAGFVCGTTTTFSPFGVGWTTSASDRLNEQILTLAAQSAVADTLAAVGARVESMVGGATASVSATPQYLLGGQSSMRGLLEAHGQSMLEGEMEYERLLDGASFVAPLRASDGEEGGAGIGPIAMWGSTNYRTLDVDDDDFDWDGGVSNTNFGVDAQVGESMLAGVALSWSRGKFDYDGTGDAGSGEYEYNAANISPYFGWSPRDGLSLWAMAGVGDGEIEVETQDGANNSTDTSQYALAAGMKSQKMASSTGGLGSIALSMKGDVAAVRVAVDESEDGFTKQEVGGERVRLLLAGEYTRELANGGRMVPSLEVGARYDDGDGNTGTGMEWGGGLRYTNAANTLSLKGGIRALGSIGYDELGADLLVRLSPPSGRGLSLRVHPVWGKTQSATERLWNDGANDLASKLGGNDAALQGTVDSEVGYGIERTMLGKTGLLTPYTGLSVESDGVGRLRLGGRFAGGGGGMSLNLEGAREDAVDGVSHSVLLRGEFAF